MDDTITEDHFEKMEKKRIEEETREKHKKMYQLMAEIVRGQVKIIDCMAGTLYNDGYRRGKLDRNPTIEEFVAKNHTAQKGSDG